MRIDLSKLLFHIVETKAQGQERGLAKVTQAVSRKGGASSGGEGQGQINETERRCHPAF